MADQFQCGIGWSLVETNTAYFPYTRTISGSLPTLSSNVATFAYGSNLAAFTGETPLGVGNLTAITKVGTQDWGGAVGDSEYFYLAHGTGLKFKMSSASGWKIMATNNAGTEVGVGSTEYAWASSANVNNISVLRESTRVRVWVNGVKEIDASGISSTAWDATAITYVGSNGTAHASKFLYIGQILRASTDVADRYLDPTGITFQTAHPVTGTGMHNDFGTNNYDDVDDWASGAADGDTTTNQDAGVASTTYRTYNLATDFTLSNALGGMHFSVGRGNVNPKNTSGLAGIGDGTNKIEKTAVTYVNVSYLSAAVPFPLAPDSGAWSAFTMNNLQIGLRHDVGALDDIVFLTAMSMEFFGCTFLSDPSTTRRRVGPTLMSPGVF